MVVGRISMGEISPDGGHVPYEGIGNNRSRVGHDRILRAYQFRSFQVRFAGEGSYFEEAIRFLDVVQSRQAVDINEETRCCQTQLQKRNQAHSSRQDLRFRSMLLQQPYGLAHARWR